MRIVNFFIRLYATKSSSYKKAKKTEDQLRKNRNYIKKSVRKDISPVQNKSRTCEQREVYENRSKREAQYHSQNQIEVTLPITISAVAFLLSWFSFINPSDSGSQFGVIHIVTGIGIVLMLSYTLIAARIWNYRVETTRAYVDELRKHDNNTLRVTLHYKNNLTRMLVGTVEYTFSEDATIEDLFVELIKMLKEKDDTKFYHEPLENNHFSIQSIPAIDPKMKVALLDTTDITVDYLEVIPPNCSRCISNFENALKETGFRFEFYSSEKSHSHLPHINAFYGAKRNTQKMVRIAIETGDVLDPLPKGLNSRKIKCAIEYVKNHKEDLLNEWKQFVQTE